MQVCLVMIVLKRVLILKYDRARNKGERRACHDGFKFIERLIEQFRKISDDVSLRRVQLLTGEVIDKVGSCDLNTIND